MCVFEGLFFCIPEKLTLTYAKIEQVGQGDMVVKGKTPGNLTHLSPVTHSKSNTHTEPRNGNY